MIEAVKVSEPMMQISEAAVDFSHTEIPGQDMLTTYVLKGTSGKRALAVEVTAQGLVIQVYDREYYEEFVED